MKGPGQSHVTRRNEVLEAARQQCGLSVAALWHRYIELGGSGLLPDVAGYLGREPVNDREYDFLAHALNEEFMTHDLDWPVPYVEDLEP